MWKLCHCGCVLCPVRRAVAALLLRSVLTLTSQFCSVLYPSFSKYEGHSYLMLLVFHLQGLSDMATVVFWLVFAF